jgi:hypothetical protein
MEATQIIAHKSGRAFTKTMDGLSKESASKMISRFKKESDTNVLSQLGIHFGIDNASIKENLHNMMQYKFARMTMDSLQSSVTIPSANVPVQFLQFWAPGYVNVITKARRADELLGMQMQGAWYDEQIVQGLAEELGLAIPYSDYQNTPFAEDNENFIYRTIVRFNLGIRVGALEEARKALINIDVAGKKRSSAARQLEIQRNQIGLYGFNSGNNYTYGFFNDPSLPDYIEVPENAADTSTMWADKTLLEIDDDIRNAISALRTQSGDQIDPERTNMTLALPTSVVDQLSQTADFGYSVRKWMKDSYPRIRVVSAPELDNAFMGDNVFYLYADEVDDDSTDGNQTWGQPTQAKFMVLGVAKYENYFVESYINSTAGALLKRPFAVVRYYGI